MIKSSEMTSLFKKYLRIWGIALIFPRKGRKSEDAYALALTVRISQSMQAKPRTAIGLNGRNCEEGE